MSTEAPPAPTNNAVSNWMTALDATAAATPPAKPAEPAAIAPVEQPKPEPTPDKPEPAPAASTEPAKTDEEKWPRSAKDWETFRAKRKEKEDSLTKEIEGHKSKVKEYEDKLAKANTSGDAAALQDKLTQKEKEANELSERLRLVAVEKHPKFEAYFSNKVNAQYELAKRIVGPESAEAIITALKLEDGPYKEQRLEELTTGLSPIKQSQLGSVLTSLAAVQQERETEIASARTNYEKMTKEQEASRAKNLADRQQLVEKTFAEQLAKAQDSKDGLFLFQNKEGDEAWNKEVSTRIDAAKNLFSGNNNPPDTLAKASMYAVALPSALKWGMERDAEVKRLEAQVKSLTAANPSVQHGDKKPATGEAPRASLKSSMNPMDASNAWVKSIQGELER